MSLKNFTQEQKLTVLKSADKVGIKQAAQIAGVHYTTVYDWRNKLDSLGETNFLSYKPSLSGTRQSRKFHRRRKKQCWTAGKTIPGLAPGKSGASFVAKGLLYRSAPFGKS